jgi:hypothetical protein
LIWDCQLPLANNGLGSNEPFSGLHMTQPTAQPIPTQLAVYIYISRIMQVWLEHESPMTIVTVQLDFSLTRYRDWHHSTDQFRSSVVRSVDHEHYLCSWYMCPFTRYVAPESATVKLCYIADFFFDNKFFWPGLVQLCRKGMYYSRKSEEWHVHSCHTVDLFLVPGISQTLSLAERFCFRNITTDPLVLIHVNIDCQDDRHPKYKIYIAKLNLDSYEYTPVAYVKINCMSCP